MYRNFKTTLLYGITGTGKTQFMRKYIEEILNDSNDNSLVILIDPKMTAFRTYAKRERVLVYLSDNIEKDFDKYTLELIQERMEYYKLKQVFDELPTIYFFFDEYHDTFPNIEDTAKTAMAFLFEHRKELKIELVMATQYASANARMYWTVDTKIHFITAKEDEFFDSSERRQGKYRDFENVVAVGNGAMITQLIKDFKEEVSKDSEVLQFSTDEYKENIRILEKLIADRTDITQVGKKLDYLYVFVEYSGNQFNRVQFNHYFRRILKASKLARIQYIAYSKSPREYPIYLENYKHTRITFPVPRKRLV